MIGAGDAWRRGAPTDPKGKWVDFRVPLYTSANARFLDVQFHSYSHAHVVAYDGCDWRRLTQFVRDTGPYTTGDQWDLHRSFLSDGDRPDGRCGGWTGYGSSGAGVQHFIWNGLFHRVGYMNIFWQYACLNPDLTFSQSAKDMSVAFTELRDGLGMLLNHARRQPTPVAVHYSLASCHGATILGQDADWDAARANTIALLNDLGWQFSFVSTPQLEADELAKRGYRALVLPWSVALSDKEVAALTQFVEAGGSLLVWGDAGSMDEHCAARPASALAELLKTVPKGDGPIRGGRVGKGRVAVAQVLASDYAKQSTAESAAALRQALTESLRSVGRDLPCQVLDAKEQPLLQCQRTYFRDGDATYVCLLRDNLAGQRVGCPEGVEYVRDTGDAAKPELITIRLRQPAEVYDVRLGKYLGKSDRIETTIASAEPKVFALLAGKGTSLTVGTGEAALGKPLALEVAVRAEARHWAPHVVQVEVARPDGALPPLYARNLLVGETPAALVIPFAFNDPAGTWPVRVRDVASGVSETCPVGVK